ncbi:MAG: secondary thiamine-phosphate synthase enzyme YjbQ [Myxococcota bacterium]
MTGFFDVETEAPEQSIDVTDRVKEIVKQAGVERGLCQIMVLHSTAAIVVNEVADPNIGRDVIRALGDLVPTKNDWLHDRRDDNAHSHVKASLLGPSELVPVRDGELLLGRWQGIWMFEFDGPRTRRVAVHFLRDAG